MKIKTSELTGAALDWAVAKCDGPRVNAYGDEVKEFIQYSRDWAQGGPIIEHESIELSPPFVALDGTNFSTWSAKIHRSAGDIKAWQDGPTPLIAAMRCYVASKLGYEVEVPNELL